MEDLKSIVVAGIVPLALLAWFSEGEWIEPNFDWEPRWETPTVTFVEPGTPGAITLEEYNEQRYGWERP